MNKSTMPDICKNCGKTSTDHAWVSRRCNNGETYEELVPFDEYIEKKCLLNRRADSKEGK